MGWGGEMVTYRGRGVPSPKLGFKPLIFKGSGPRPLENVWFETQIPGDVPGDAAGDAPGDVSGDAPGDVPGDAPFIFNGS